MSLSTSILGELNSISLVEGALNRTFRGRLDVAIHSESYVPAFGNCWRGQKSFEKKYDQSEQGYFLTKHGAQKITKVLIGRMRLLWPNRDGERKL